MVAAVQDLGADAASVMQLSAEGSIGTGTDGQGGGGGAAGTLAGRGNPASLLLFSVTQGSQRGMARAAEISLQALNARIEGAIRHWEFDKEDVVLPLGLMADTACAVVDAMEAPLAAGGRIAWPEATAWGPRSQWSKAGGAAGPRLVAAETPEDMWARLLEAPEATKIFISSECVLRLLEHHSSLASGLRAELAARWRSRPLRLTVALASPGSVVSPEQSQHWLEVFGGCPLTWHFSCPEAGSLFSVAGSAGSGTAAAPAVAGHCVDGLEWQVGKDGELHVRGQALFTGYQGRPRSTAEAFNTEGFCPTGQRVREEALGSVGLLCPEPSLYDRDTINTVATLLRREPNVEGDGGPTMMPDWKVKKVPIRTYEYWRTRWGGVLPTKKHNQAHKVYKGKYR